MSTPIPRILAKLTSSGYSAGQIGESLGVSHLTITRWQSGKAKPRPHAERQLRELLATVQEQTPEYGSQAELGLTGEFELRRAVDRTLREIRESLHRRARLSSRGEALEEVSKLLFAHIVSMSAGCVGISSELLSSGFDQAARRLKQFVANVFATSLPKMLAHEIEPTEFHLRLNDNESELAVDLIQSFHRFFGYEKRASFELTNVDVLNDVFGTFLSDSFIDEKQLGQYLTPPEVVKFMVDLALSEMTEQETSLLLNSARCRDFGLVLDPSCGVGSFLAEFIRKLHPLVDDDCQETGDVWLRQMMTGVIAGIDKSERMIKLALANMAMFGLPAAHLQLANSIAKPSSNPRATQRLDGTVGLILTNPPFGAEFEKADTTGFRIAKTDQNVMGRLTSEVLFIERYLDWLRPGGQLVAIVPDSILTNKGIFQSLRDQIKQQVEIRSIISLPSITFAASGTTTKTSILHLRKRNATRARRPSRFAICSEIGYSVVTRGAQRMRVGHGSSELPGILLSIQSGDELRFRFVDDAEELMRWDAGFHAAIPSNVEKRLLEHRKGDVRVSNVANLSGERDDPRRWGTKTFRYIEISDIDEASSLATAKLVPCEDAPSRARRVVRKGDVLVSTVRPERKAIGVVTGDNDGAICTTGFAVLRPKRIHPLILAQLLRSDFATLQILRNNVGIAYPAIEEKCLLDILLPVTHDKLRDLNSLGDGLLAQEAELHGYRNAFGERLHLEMQAWSMGQTLN